MTEWKALKKNQVSNNGKGSNTKCSNKNNIHFESIFDSALEGKLSTVFILLKERQYNPASKEIDIKDDIPESVNISEMMLILQIVLLTFFNERVFINVNGEYHKRDEADEECKRDK